MQLGQLSSLCILIVNEEGNKNKYVQSYIYNLYTYNMHTSVSFSTSSFVLSFKNTNPIFCNKYL